MSEPLAPDLCIIGAGSGGLTLAAAARAVGLSVVLIERGAMGGECLNTGCVPSKALIAAARHAHAVRRAKTFGIDAEVTGVDYARVHAHIHDVIAAIAPHDSQERFERLGATVIRESARFTGPDTVAAGRVTVRAKRFVIATGSSPVVPDVPGIASVPVLTNESLFDLAALPSRLVVIGGGPIGLEMAQAFARLGSSVTVVQSSRPLSRDDPDAAAIVVRRLEAEGVRILSGTRPSAVEARDGGALRVTVEGAGGRYVLEASHILAATGRRPNVADLDLPAAGIAMGDRGIAVDGALRSLTNRRVYAVGDVAGSFHFTHWAGHQAGLVLRSILTRIPARPKTDGIVWCTYTDPELAQVGLTEAEARDRHGDGVSVLQAPFSSNDRAQADRDTEGFVKIVAGRRGRILGATLVGPQAGESAAPFALALANGLKVGAFAHTVLAYPTLAETGRRAALSAYADLARRPLAAFVLGILRRTLR